MIENSFTREQAIAASKDYRHLVGQGYDDTCLVADIVVSPLDPLNKWIFNNFYAEQGNARKALEFYQGPFYDVMVIASAGMKYTDLRSFLKQNGIEFDPAKY
jgi:hypothetical protein